MPVILPSDLPAYALLLEEGYSVLRREETGGAPVRIGLLNLMPNKEITEAHFARVLSHTLAPVEMALLKLSSHEPQNVSPEHMQSFYTPWQQARDKPLHGIIVTGAPVEHLRYEEVGYWPEMRGLLDWIRQSGIPALFICWAAQAAIYHYYGAEKTELPSKALGLFPHRAVKPDALLRGFDDIFDVPVSRHTEIPRAALAALPEVDILSESDLSGVYIARDRAQPLYYVFNHLEYTSDTIMQEYFRDLRAGKPVPLPYNYFPAEDPRKNPLNLWRSHASLLYSNWVQQCSQPVYRYSKYLNIAIAGLGTVGGHVVQLLDQHRDMIRERTGCEVRLIGVSARDRAKDRACSLPEGTAWCEDPLDLPSLPDVDIIVEAIGSGIDPNAKDRADPARALIYKAIAAGKHVVTANKSLMAHEGLNLFLEAERKGVTLGFEAAIGGAVPVIKTVREALASDSMSSITAILNGTSNYILCAMENESVDFKTALARAQALGYAEADPAADIDGLDTAHKINVLSCLTFGCNTRLQDMPVRGIRDIDLADIRAARNFGYRIKLLAQTWKEEKKIGIGVSPYLVPSRHALAEVGGAYNAILYTGNFIGELFLRGFGAGGKPTAAAVVSDIIDIARRRNVFGFGIPVNAIATVGVSADYWPRPYYLRQKAPFAPDLIQKSEIVDGWNVAITAPLLAREAAARFGSAAQMLPLYIPESAAV